MLIGRIRAATIAGTAVVAVVLASGAAAAGFNPWTEGDVADVAPLADADQEQALSDEPVTRAEYDGAIANAVACMREAGIDAHAVEGQAGGIGANGQVSDGQAAAGQDCIAVHAERISLAWATQNAPTEAAHAAAREDATACYIANGGVVAKGVLSSDEIAGILRSGTDEEAEALGPCLQANMEKHGFGW